MTYVQSYLCIIGLTLCMKESKAVLAEETVKYVCSGDSIQLFRNVTIDTSDMVVSLYIKASSERIIAMWTFTKGTIYEGYTTKIFLDKDGDIWIRNVSPSDEARYSLITGQGTNFVRYNVTLSVQVAPSINCKPSIIRVDDVLVASLDAKECGKPIASVDWFDYSGIQKKGNDNMLIKTNTYGIYYACISGPAVKCAKTEKPLDYCSAFAISDTTDNHDVSITLGIEHKVSTYFAGLLIAILLVVVLVSVLIFRSICKNLTSCRIENGTEDVEKSAYNAVPLTSESSDVSNPPETISGN